MLLILGIVAVVLIAKIKPMFQDSIKVSTAQSGVETKTATK